MSRDVNRRGKKGGQHSSGRYGNNSPNFHHRNNYMGAETPNWREPLPSGNSAQAQQKAHLAYGEFLMRGWSEFEEEFKRGSRLEDDFKPRAPMKGNPKKFESEASSNTDHSSGQVRTAAAQ